MAWYTHAHTHTSHAIIIIINTIHNKLGTVVYACNLQAWEVETGGYIS